MRPNVKYIAIALVTILVLSLGLTGCRFALEPAPGQQEPPLSSSPVAEAGPGESPPQESEQEPREEAPTESSEPEEPQSSSVEKETLPLGVEVRVDQGKTAIGPFFSLLPELTWSPDGKYLAIAGEAGGYGLWVWSRETNKARRLVQLLNRGALGATTLTFLGWNREGTALFYAVDGIQPEGPHLGNRGVTVMTAYLDGSCREVAWLPSDAELIRGYYFDSMSGRLLLHRGHDLWRVETESGEVMHLKTDLPTWDGLFGVHFSPSGETVVYPDTEPGKHNLVLLDVESGRETRVGEQSEYAFYPVWSPDGQKLAFLSARAEGETYDFQIGEDGPLPPATRLVVVTKEGNAVAAWVPPQGEKAGAPVWAGDSSRVALLSGTVAKDEYGLTEVSWRRLLLGMPGQPLRDLGTVRGDWLSVAGFSPDGDKVLVYRYELSGGVTVLGYGPEPNQVQTLAHEAVDEPPVWWQGWLLLPRLAAGPADNLDTQVYLVGADSAPQGLTTGAGWKSRLNFSGRWLAYLSADNQNAPYPITVVIQPIPQ